MSEPLLTLEEWARKRYTKPPAMKTLRRWAREAKIIPRPEKHGREYRVQEDAVYMNYNDERRAHS